MAYNIRLSQKARQTLVHLTSPAFSIYNSCLSFSVPLILKLNAYKMQAFLKGGKISTTPAESRGQEEAKKIIVQPWVEK